MGHLYHGYVSHNQRVLLNVVSLGLVSELFTVSPGFVLGLVQGFFSIGSGLFQGALGSFVWGVDWRFAWDKNILALHLHTFLKPAHAYLMLHHEKFCSISTRTYIILRCLLYLMLCPKNFSCVFSKFKSFTMVLHHELHMIGLYST